MSELISLNEIIERKRKEIHKLNRQIFFAQRKIHRANLRDAISAKQINLNVGAGDTYIDNFIGLDYHTQHFGDPIIKGQIPFDIRNDKIPFDANSVENIYISHVIEHIEDIHVERFFNEAHRVLKPGGVLRVSCPDAKYIWDRGRLDLSFWKRRTSWFKKRGINTNELDAFDYLIREISTPKLRCVEPSNTKHDKEELNKLHGVASKMTCFADAMEMLTEGVEFDPDLPGDHINYWTFEKILNVAGESFSKVIQSRYKGSVSPLMTSAQFDLMAPWLSLYVDCVK